MALLTASGKTWSGGETVDGAGRLSAEAAGCRQLSAAKVESSGTASLSSEHSSRTAPFTSPSSSLADAIAAATWSPVFDLMLRAVGQLGGSGSVPSSYCMSCFKTDVVKLRDLPPRVGFTRHDEEKPSSFDQLDEDDGCIRTSLINFCSRFAAAGRAPFGILFRICRRGGWTRTSFCDSDTVGVAVMMTSADDAPGAAIWTFGAAAT